MMEILLLNLVFYDSILLFNSFQCFINETSAWGYILKPPSILKTLEQVKEKNLILELIQENSIEFLDTKYLSYILTTFGPCSTIAYPK